MADLPTYPWPLRSDGGVLLGLSLPRLAAIGTAGVVLIVAMLAPTLPGVAAAFATMGMLLVAATVRAGGRVLVEWLPVAAGYGWATVTRNRTFARCDDLALDLPTGTLDLPGELFGIELHEMTVDEATASVANPTTAAYAVVRDTFRNRLIAIAELSAPDFLLCDPSVQQARVGAWGSLLDHVAHALPEIRRLQVVHTIGPSSPSPLLRHHTADGGHGPGTTAASYRQVCEVAGAAARDHRALLAIGLDLASCRRAVRQAGGGLDGAARVLMDRAATIEQLLGSGGLQVHGWLPARAIGGLLRVAFDPAAHARADLSDDVTAGGGVDPAAAGPYGMHETWSRLRHDSGWSTTLQVARPPSRPVPGDFLQHLLIGAPVTRRLSMLYVPTPTATAQRQATSAQISADAEAALRTRWGFTIGARQRRSHDDAARREADLVDGRAVYRTSWTVTVTATDPADLESDVEQVEAAARRCGLDLRRLTGLQRQGCGFTLPLCRGAG